MRRILARCRTGGDWEIAPLTAEEEAAVRETWTAIKERGAELVGQGCSRSLAFQTAFDEAVAKRLGGLEP